MIFAVIVLVITLATVTNAAIKKVSSVEKTSAYWLREGDQDIKQRLLVTDIDNKAKNVILYIGDGMGPSTVSAARNYMNQQMTDSTSPDIGLLFETFPNTALMKTHSVDAYVADSSSTATAMVTGVKTNSKVVGVSPKVIFNNCSSHFSPEHDLVSIATLFQREGKSVGVVTTARVTHATPSALYAHSASRDWEANVPNICIKKDIAYQLIENSNMFQVILGGGLSYFLPENIGGQRKDNINLINKWENKMRSNKMKSKFVSNLTDFNSLNVWDTDYLFGLFSEDHLEYESFRVDQPSLEDMTETAIKILSKNEKGFFLMVEGGRIDHAHHKNRAKLALTETLSFDKAVRKGQLLTNADETLMIVTADHSHVFTMGSYAKRENDITKRNKAIFGQEKDGKGHTSLLYANGPGFRVPREDITDETVFTMDLQYNSGLPLEKETHGGEEVAVYSQGAWSHLFRGVHHQSYIGHVMMYASCTGGYTSQMHCANIGHRKRSFRKSYFFLIFVLSRIIITF